MNPEIEKQIRSISEHMTAFGDKIDAQSKKVNDVQTQVDAIDKQLAKRFMQESLNENPVEMQMKESDSLSRLFKERRGTAVVKFKDAAYARIAQGLKTTITETQQGFMTTGVMPIERIPGIVPEARQVLTVRNVLTATPTTQAVVDFVRVSTPLSIASPVPEASLKPENQLSFNSIREKVRTLATWVPASKQILDDMTEMMGFIQSSMPYYVNLAEELQLLFGDGTGENLHGLVPQASAFVGGLPAGSTRIDAIGAAIAQIQTAKELPPTFAIVHPQDWWGMRLLKDNYGRYVLGDPQTVVTPSLFGLTVIPTTSMAVGSFLVGSGAAAASEIRDRMELVVEISTEHADYFVKNLVAVRAEKRLTLVVKRPSSYIVGSFTGLKSIQ
jgi:HK97 family phage major capsid protein